MDPVLLVVTYHYVRDPARTEFPRINFLPADEFCRQIEFFRKGFEMATLETALAYLDGAYQPSRNLLLLTFDDGVKEHSAFVTPMLKQCGIQGLFFLISSSDLAPVHMNHFLMASLPFQEYRGKFLEILPNADQYSIDENRASKQYPYDEIDIARFKYLLNFVLPASIRDAVLKELFEQTLGDTKTFADALYVSWDEARAMQEAGMVIGGHSHRHKPLEQLNDTELRDDLDTCRRILDANLHPQQAWPFGYPYGKALSYGDRTVAHLRRLGFHCGFTTERGVNLPTADVFSLRRFDCKNVIKDLSPFSNVKADRIAIQSGL